MRLDENLYKTLFYKQNNFEDVSQVAANVYKKPQFHYGKVSYASFNQVESTSGWFGRKVIALPAALWCAVVKTTYHLTLALFIGLPKILAGEPRYLQAKLFSVVRDLQEAFGRFISLFHDTYGQYHVAEASFQKSLYDYFTIAPLSTLSKQQFDELFRFWSVDATKRFATYSPNDVREAMNNGYFSRLQQYQLVTDFQFAAIQLSKLSGIQIEQLFSGLTTKESRARFARLPVAEVQAAYDAGRLSTKVQGYFSQVHKEQVVRKPPAAHTNAWGIPDDPFFQNFFGNFFGANTFFDAVPLEPAKDHHATLGIAKTATQDEIKAAYKKLAMKHHPDRIKQNEGESKADFEKRQAANAEEFKKYADAYANLIK